MADPTGCGEGFSYVKVPNKPTQQKVGPSENISPPLSAPLGACMEGKIFDPVRFYRMTKSRSLLRRQ